MFKISFSFEADADNEAVATLVAQATSILKGLTTMTTQAETILADLAAAKASSDAANTKCAELVALANDIKGKLDTALATGTGMTTAEMQAVRDAISELAVGDDAAKAAAAAAIVADTPLVPVPPVAVP